MEWKRLIRFVDEAGDITYGDACIQDEDDVESLVSQGKLYASRFEGDDPFALRRTTEKVRVARLLGVLDRKHVKVFKCIGLNYTKHSKLLHHAKSTQV